MTKIIRAILTFKNPRNIEMLQLNNLIWEGTSLNEQKIYIANKNDLIHYSCDRIDNLKLIHKLSIQGLNDETINELIKKNPKPNLLE